MKVDPFMGPLIDQQSVDNYLNYMGMAKREGIEEIMRGKKLNKKLSRILCQSFNSLSNT